MAKPEAVEADGTQELAALLDRELVQLPEKYRALIVLCDLEGKTRKEAAQKLGWPEGTIHGRLARGRKLLARRLRRQGIAFSGGAMAALLSQKAASASVPASVAVSTIKAASLRAAGQKAAAGLISPEVAALAEGVVKVMLMSKLKAVVAVVLLLGFVVSGAAVLSSRTAAAQSDKLKASQQQEQKQEKQKGDKDLSALEGRWDLVWEEHDGEKRELIFKSYQLTFKGKKITTAWVRDDDSAGGGTNQFVISPTRNPKELTISGDNIKILAVYKVEKDQLTIAHFGKPEDTRPKGFTVADAAGGGRILVVKVLKRVQEPKRDKTAPEAQAGPKERPATPQKQAQKQEKVVFTAWGTEVGGLQAGLGYDPGQKRAYHHGETVRLVLRLRNVSKKEVEFACCRQFFMEVPPTMTDGQGKPVRLPASAGTPKPRPEKVSLAPGKEIELYELKFKLRPAGENGDEDNDIDSLDFAGTVFTFYGTGKFLIQYERLIDKPWAGPEPDPTLSKLATGKLELEIKSGPPPATPKEKSQAADKLPDNTIVTLKNVTIDQVDDRTRTVSFRFGSKEKPTKLLNIPLAEKVRVVASYRLPGSVNHLPFRWDYVKALQGKVVSVRFIANRLGVLVESISAANDAPLKTGKTKPVKLLVWIEKRNAESRSVTASCMTVGLLSENMVFQRLENLSISKSARITHKGKDIAFAHLKPGTGAILELDSSEGTLVGSSIEVIWQAPPDAGEGVKTPQKQEQKPEKEGFTAWESRGQAPLLAASGPSPDRPQNKAEFANAGLNSSWKAQATLRGHKDEVLCLAFGVDQLATASKDGSIKLWNVAKTKEEGTCKYAADLAPWRSMAFTPDGKTALLVFGEHVGVWDTSKESFPKATIGGASPLALDKGDDGFRLVLRRTEGLGKNLQIMVISRFASKNEELGFGPSENTGLFGHANEVEIARLSQDGALLAAATADKTITLWKVSDKKEQGVCKGHTDSLLAIEFSPDGKTLASSSKDGSVRLWNTATRKEQAVLKGHKGEVPCIAFSPDSSTLASGGADKTVMIWDVKAAKRLAAMKGHTDSVLHVAFSRDGNMVASASKDTTVRLWESTK
jgi:uncharacterized protein (TIGR03067 family)